MIIRRKIFLIIILLTALLVILLQTNSTTSENTPSLSSAIESTCKNYLSIDSATFIGKPYSEIYNMLGMSDLIHVEGTQASHTYYISGKHCFINTSKSFSLVLSFDKNIVSDFSYSSQ